MGDDFLYSKRNIVPLNVQKVFVMHVKKGYEERRAHIENMLERLGIDCEFMLDGDIEDLSSEVIHRYFTGTAMSGKTPGTSCALKHLLTYRTIIERNMNGALILEDDIRLSRNFVKVFNKTMDELDTIYKNNDRPVIISYEDTRLRFVPRSKRRHNKLLYPGHCDRMTGAYYINMAGARLILEYAMTHKLDRPIDLTHRKLLDEGKISYLWCQPTVASQGSATGQFNSSISLQKKILRPLMWRLQRAYKIILYFFR